MLYRYVSRNPWGWCAMSTACERSCHKGVQLYCVWDIAGPQRPTLVHFGTLCTPLRHLCCWFLGSKVVYLSMG